MRFFLGIDGGGSNTHAVVVNDVFQVIGRGHSGASNHYAVGLKTPLFIVAKPRRWRFLDAGRIERDLQPLDMRPGVSV
jgi:hypothetical protein